VPPIEAGNGIALEATSAACIYCVETGTLTIALPSHAAQPRKVGRTPTSAADALVGLFREGEQGPKSRARRPARARAPAGFTRRQRAGISSRCWRRTGRLKYRKTVNR